MESFYHTLKTEMVYFQKFRTLEEATAYIIDYIRFYNSERLCKPPLKSVHSEVEIFGQTNESQEIEDEEESVQ
jgi:hypothetical protein